MSMQHFTTYDPLPGDAGRYRKVTPVRAVQMSRPFSVNDQTGRAGDWLAEDERGNLRIIPDEVFQESYVSVGWGDISPDRNPTPSVPLPVGANP